MSPVQLAGLFGRRAITVTVCGVMLAACDSATTPSPSTSPLSPPEPPAITVLAVTATSLTGTVGRAVTPAPAVRATDVSGAPVAGVRIDFAADGSGQIGRTSVETGADGVAAVQEWVLGPQAGRQTLVAGRAGRPSVSFTATAKAGPVAQLTGTNGNHQHTWSGETLLHPLEVRATDEFGNPIEALPLTFGASDGAGTIAGAATVTDTSGVARSGRWTLGAATGPQHVTATAGSVSFVFTATANARPTLDGRIAFVSDRAGSPDIYAIMADGTGLRRITTSAARDIDPAWSPDGARIAFISDRHGKPELLVINAEGSNPTRIAPTLQLADGPAGPAWSPDGSLLGVTNVHDRSIGIATVRLVDGEIVHLRKSPGYDAQPSWSPDGRQLAFISDRLASDFVYSIFTMNADGTDQRLRTEEWAVWPELNFYMHPAWSPDGSRIAYVSVSGSSTDYRFSVGVLNLATHERRTIAWAGDIPWLEVFDPGSLAWSPDGQGIAYSHIDCDLLTNTGCTRARSIRYIALDGSHAGTLVPDAYNPSWIR
jgi:Tol biopolymer transport system component